jgi:hypothetical protein
VGNRPRLETEQGKLAACHSQGITQAGQRFYLFIYLLLFYHLKFHFDSIVHSSPFSAQVTILAMAAQPQPLQDSLPISPLNQLVRQYLSMSSPWQYFLVTLMYFIFCALGLSLSILFYFIYLF